MFQGKPHIQCLVQFLRRRLCLCHETKRLGRPQAVACAGPKWPVCPSPSSNPRHRNLETELQMLHAEAADARGSLRDRLERAI